MKLGQVNICFICLLTVCISLAFDIYNLQSVCVEGNCRFAGEGYYKGCVVGSNNILLRFDRFTGRSVLDLRKCPELSYIIIESMDSFHACDFLLTETKTVVRVEDQNKLCEFGSITTSVSATSGDMKVPLTVKTTTNAPTSLIMPDTADKFHRITDTNSPRTDASTVEPSTSQYPTINTEPSPSLTETDDSGNDNITILMTSSIITTSLTVISVCSLAIMFIIRCVKKRKQVVRERDLPYRVNRMRSHFDTMHNIIDNIADCEL